MIKSADTLDSSTFAVLTNISDRAARKALATCYLGKTWRGHRLTVRRVRASGGPGGERYEVLMESLPEAIRSAAAGRATQEYQAASALPTTSNAGIIHRHCPSDITLDWKSRHAILQPILKTAPRSTARSEAIAAAIGREIVTSNGPLRLTERTLYRWLSELAEKGLAGLKRKQRADKAQSRVLISRIWDALDLSRGAQEQIKAELVTYIRSLWAKPTTHAGWKVTASHASAELRRLTAAALDVPISQVAKEACAVPRTLVEREKSYRAVGTHDRDRKEYEDRTRPRISRSLPEQPMQIVMGDVHPLDIYHARDDGSLATAKLIAFLDVGTGRIRLTPQFFEKGQGVREAHVISAFIEMALDPLWGLPRKLYLDNGSEYQWDQFISDAMELCEIRFAGDEGAIGSAGPVIRAQPYNAPAKGLLEGAFCQLEQRFFSLIPGWIGGDRLRTKAANVGKSPVQYPGSKEELIRDIKHVEAAFNDTSQDGRLNGQSPNERFAELVTAGWQRTDIDEAALYAAFCEKVGRVIRQGHVRNVGKDFYHDALAALPAGTNVLIGVPKWGDTGRISVYDEKGTFLCLAHVDTPFAHDDPAGAKEAGRRQKIARDAIRQKRAQTKPIDGRELLAVQAASAEPVPVPKGGSIIRFNAHDTAAGKALSTPAKLQIDQEEQEKFESLVNVAATLKALRIASAGG